MHAALLVPALALALAWALDRGLSEPPAALHPVVGMGALLNRLAPWVLAGPGRQAALRGAAAWGLGAGVCVALAAGSQALVLSLPGAWAALPLALLLKPLFAWRMLHDEVAAVEDALALSLDAGRERLARLVSRDVSALTDTEVREAAIETLAENLNDSVVAPLFWFALGGLPAAALYRWANTADAMWGYRGRWEWGGKWAARADDALSWLPARLTAVLIGRGDHPWHRLAEEAARTPSPNGGWPMGAMALALDVHLGKPGVYSLNTSGQAAQDASTRAALQRAGRAAWRALGGCMVLALIHALILAWVQAKAPADVPGVLHPRAALSVLGQYGP